MNTTKNTRIRPLHYFKTDHKITRFLSVLLAFLVLQLPMGCNYYRVKEVPLTRENMAEQIREFNGQDNYAMINESWHLRDLTVNEDTRTISGMVLLPGEQHRASYKRVPNKSYRYRNYEKQPLNELHFEVDTTIVPVVGQQLTINFGDIKSISVNNHDTGRTILTVVGTTIGILFVSLIVILATKSSCPFVYIRDGDTYVFMGELYPGVITPQMQRLDYLSLPGFYPEDGNYTLMVTNELREIQHTDLLELWIAEHDPGTKLVPDNQGELQVFKDLHSPTAAHNRSSHVPIHPLLSADDIFYGFDEGPSTPESTRELVLEFDKPPEAQKAKLWLTAKNSLWLDYVFGKFNEQFGAYYNTFQKKQQDIPRETSIKWMEDQHIPLSVFVKGWNGWELAGHLSSVGPMATRDLAVPLDLRDLPPGKVQVKLECGFKFWELDYAGIDYSENTGYNITKIAPAGAIDEEGRDVTSLLLKADGDYLTQPEIGNEVTVTFKAPALHPGMVQSAFLVNRGYYNYIRDYDGIPDLKRLKAFREKHTFTRFSENMYMAVMAMDDPVDIALNDE